MLLLSGKRLHFLALCSCEFLIKLFELSAPECEVCTWAWAVGDNNDGVDEELKVKVVCSQTPTHSSSPAPSFLCLSLWTAAIQTWWTALLSYCLHQSHAHVSFLFKWNKQIFSLCSPAGGENFLLGENLTVAVLGVVIPIGELPESSLSTFFVQP